MKKLTKTVRMSLMKATIKPNKITVLPSCHSNIFATALMSRKTKKSTDFDGLNSNNILEVYEQIENVFKEFFKIHSTNILVPECVKVKDVSAIFAG